MDSTTNNLMDGYYEPVCRPLTKRLMIVGVPSNTFFGLLMTAMYLITLRLYVCLPLFVVGFVILRRIYAHDQWAMAGFLNHFRMVAKNRTELEV